MAEGSKAGVTGVEPAETHFGDECLTVWRHPYKAERERFELSGAIRPTHLAGERTRPLCDLSVMSSSGKIILLFAVAVNRFFDAWSQGNLYLSTPIWWQIN